MEDVTEHEECERAYRAGVRYAIKHGLCKAHEIEEAASQYEDAESFYDGYYNKLHKDEASGLGL